MEQAALLNNNFLMVYVLLIEDDADLRLEMKMGLEKAGHTVSQFALVLLAYFQGFWFFPFSPPQERWRNLIQVKKRGYNFHHIVLKEMKFGRLLKKWPKKKKL